MVAYTTLLQLRKPTVGGDPDLWGGYLNDGADIIDLLMTMVTPCGHRLTGTTAVPVTTSDVTAIATLYCTPDKHAGILNFDGTYWDVIQQTELSMAFSSNSGHTNYHQSDKNFDVWYFDDSGTKRIGPDECWEWKGHLNNKGYGEFFIEQPRYRGPRTRMLAHRFSFEMHHRPLPAGQFACHKCDRPCCVNPAHLFVGTPKDNTRDMVAKGRAKGGPINPPRGSDKPNSRLTEEQVRAIRSDERPAPVVAKDYPVTRASIDAIRKRKTWKHI